MKEEIKKTFQITQWISSYNREKFKDDLVAGLSTGLMFIPQGMAYALIAGVPPIYGLYAGIVPLIIYPLFCSSRHISVGPVAIDMLIIGAGLTAIAQPQTPGFISLVILLTLMTGVFQLIMGFLKLGSVLNFFSRPIIAGFTLAAPIIIAGSQLGNLFGIKLGSSKDIFIIFTELAKHIGNTHYLTLIWGLIAIVVLFILKKIFPTFPSAAIILFGSIAAAYYLNAGSKGVVIVGNIPSGLPSFMLPDIDIGNIRELLTTAMILTLVQFMAIASLGRTFARRNNYIFNANRELVAIGAANFLGSFFRAIPVSASFSRSAAAEQAHVKTPLANSYTAIIIIATLIFLTPIFYYLPMPALAAIIIVSVLRLINIREFINLFKTNYIEGFIAIFTAGCTLFVGIQEGIFLGIVASLIYTLHQHTRPHVAELGLIPGTRLFQDIARHKNAIRIRKVLILRIDASFSYMNADFFRDFILEKSQERNKTTKYIVIDGSAINRIDTTAIEQLEIMVSTLRGWGMDLYLTGLNGPIRDMIVKSGLIRNLGPNHLFREPHEAVQYLLKIMDDERLENYRKEINAEEH